MSRTSKHVPAVIEPATPNRVTQAILDFVSRVPDSKVEGSDDPATAARQLGQRAAQRAALAAGSLALPPGPLGWFTLLPELTLIWKIQAQLVSDIAAVYGRQAELGREQMLWCLFRHTAAQAFRDLVVQMGDRLMFRRMSHAVVERVAKQVGVKITSRTLGEGLSRWLPVVGALGVGAYAYYDTGQVAGTAIALFGGEVEITDDDGDERPAPAKTKPAARKPSAKTVAVSRGKAVGKAVKQAARKLATGAAKKAVKAARKTAATTKRKPRT